MTTEVKTSISRAYIWSFLEGSMGQSVQFVVKVMLCRFLMPEQFGLVAMLNIFIQIAQVLIDSGFSSALIQRKNATYIDECSIFYFNIVAGFAVACLMFISAPLIALYCNNTPLMEPIARAFSLYLIITSFSGVQLALLTKQLNFKVQTKISVITGLLAGAVGITMAYYGFGVWSLVWHQIAIAFFRTSLFWVFCPWRPSWKFSYGSLAYMFPFASKILLTNMIDTVYNNIFYLWIGKRFSLTTLGYYSHAEQIVTYLTRNFCFPIARAAFPVFSSLQKDKVNLKKEARKAFSISALLHFPMMIGLAAVAKPLVLVLFTEKWLPSVPFIQFFCAGSVLYPCQMINLQLLTALGRSDLYLRVDIFKRILMTTFLLLTIPFGIMAIVYGGIVVSIVAYYLSGYYINKLMSYSVTEQMIDVAAIFLASAIMGATVLMLGLIPMNNILLLVLQVPLGVIIYIMICYLLKLESFNLILPFLLQEYKKALLFLLEEYKKIRQKRNTID